ncbi:hypothetical protein [Rhodoferax aquaticus]|uniref:Uncharacterized protein n=1 Tax=Rhodoferax aquaticus TaxID=2527691 RepID=A0A515EQG9_9BURK|nr:hypothetical protein [Rhodoferax aquaticus]QDL54896.1 hypothetical protein EXZ61_12390 [Rhodoferax aquaticus]
MTYSFEEFRIGHLVRTAAVWTRLSELGTTEESLVNFDFSFSAPSKAAVEALKETLSTYPIEVQSRGFLKKRYTVTGSTGAIAWNEAQLLKWVDYLIQAGQDANCKFEGCGANAP